MGAAPLSPGAFCTACALLLLLCASTRRLALTWAETSSSCDRADGASVTVALLSAPRPNDHALHFVTTLQSLVKEWPLAPGKPSPYRVSAVNHFGTAHRVFRGAQCLFNHTDAPVEWLDRAVPIPAEGSHVFHRQRLHAHSALSAAAAGGADYVLLLEDDFPLCPGAWGEIEQQLCECHKTVPESRGLFVGTGGSGALVKRAHLPGLLKRLDLHPLLQDPVWKARADACLESMDRSIAAKQADEKVQEMEEWCEHHLKHDVILQRFLLEAPLCVSAALMFYHTGYASSTLAGNGDGRTKPDWQCGWRQPLTTSPHAVVLGLPP